MTQCQNKEPLILKQGNPGEFDLIPIDEYDQSVNSNDTIVWGGFECQETTESELMLIEQDNQSFYLRNEVSTGEFMLTSVILFLIIITFIDLIERRVMPRFVRFWK